MKLYSKEQTERNIFVSKDGSKTIYWPAYDEHYHSVNGAITESNHVFINAGLKQAAKQKNNIHIFEMGFGTGLNTLLSYEHAKQNNLSIHYTSIEAFPLENELIQDLDFKDNVDIDHENIDKIYAANWNSITCIDHFFKIHKIKTQFENYVNQHTFDVIYYDAFAPSAQPELWTKEIFEKLYQMLNKNGILTTYCAKGQVKRDLKAVGFTVEALPGPPGKREMTRAYKLI